MARVPRALALLVLVVFCATVARSDEIDDIIAARQLGVGVTLSTGGVGIDIGGPTSGTSSAGSNGGGGVGGGASTDSSSPQNPTQSSGDDGSTPVAAPTTSSSTPPATTSSQPMTTSSETPSTTSSQDFTQSTTVVRVTSTPLVSLETRPVVTNVVTVIGGQTSTRQVTSQDIVSHTTGFATATAPASLNGGGGSGSGGLSDSSKKIIGGVVGGIGGAILIGAIAFVFFRMRKKRNAAQEVPDEDSFAKEARTSSAANTMFASGHADRYAGSSSPPTTVNASSNF